MAQIPLSHWPENESQVQFCPSNWAELQDVKERVVSYLPAEMVANLCYSLKGEKKMYS